jgi:predicted nucleic-acid-binding Zn-ribbon protein
MEERYPTQKKIWTCPKCESTEYSEDTVTMTGKTWSRFMNIQNRKFIAITCSNCHYTEFYKGTSKGWESVIDFLGN